MQVWYHLRPPHTSRVFVDGQKILTCHLVCGEFRQANDKIGAFRERSGSARTPTPCRALSASAANQDDFSGLLQVATNQKG